MLESRTNTKRSTPRASDSIIADILQLGLLVGGVIATIAGAVWFVRKSANSNFKRGFRRRERAVQMRQMLGQAIVGNPREAILAIFGPPRSSARFVGHTPAQSTKTPYLQANTWYYILDPHECRAMVIEFENGIAKEAQFIRGAKHS